MQQLVSLFLEGCRVVLNKRVDSWKDDRDLHASEPEGSQERVRRVMGFSEGRFHCYQVLALSKSLRICAPRSHFG